MSNHSIFAPTYQMSRNKQRTMSFVNKNTICFCVIITKKPLGFLFKNVFPNEYQMQPFNLRFYISNEQNTQKSVVFCEKHNNRYFMINTKISFNSSNNEINQR